MQYRAGLVTVHNGSNIVTGVNTAWLGKFSPGALFGLPSQKNVGPYKVAAVNNDGQITLDAPWGGDDAVNVQYWVTVDFTPIQGFPLPQPLDLDVTRVIEKALLMIDGLFEPQPFGLFAAKSQSIAVPPANPTDGDCYIVPKNDASGAWTGYGTKVAIYRRGAWLFYAPKNSMFLRVADEGAFYFYDEPSNEWILNPVLTSGSTVALREATPVDGGIPFWDAAHNIFSTDGSYTLASLEAALAGKQAHAGRLDDIVSTGITTAMFAANVVDADDTFAANSDTRISTQKAVKTYIAGQIAAIVASAPSTLDTLNELAAALGDDPNFATTTANALGNRVRVDAAQTLTSGQQAQARANIGAVIGTNVQAYDATLAAISGAGTTGTGAVVRANASVFTGTLSGAAAAFSGNVTAASLALGGASLGSNAFAVNGTGLVNGSSFSVSNTAGGSGFYINGAVGNTKGLYFRSGGWSRWLVASNNSAESGSNVGSNFTIQRYDDTGSYIDDALTIARATGETTIRGITNVGIGGTSATNTILRLQASSAANVGTIVSGRRNNVQVWAFGDAAAILGGTSTDLVFTIEGHNKSRTFLNGVERLTLDDAGSDRSVLTLTGSVPIVQFNATSGAATWQMRAGVTTDGDFGIYNPSNTKIPWVVLPTDIFNVRFQTNFDTKIVVGVAPSFAQITAAYSGNAMDGQAFVDLDSGGKVWKIGSGTGQKGVFGFYNSTDGIIAGGFGADGSFLVGTLVQGGWQGDSKIAAYGASHVISTQVTGNGTAFSSRVDNTDAWYAGFYYGTSNTGSIAPNGTTSVSYNTTSDARLKIVLTDEEQESYREVIKSLWVGDFIWKKDGSRGFGVLAQQAYDLMPNHQGVTKPANEDDQWHASAEPFAHLALWGVKDLYALVEALAARVAALEARLAV